MWALLKQKEILSPFVGSKPASMDDIEYMKQEEKAHSIILLSLSDEILYETKRRQHVCG